jgi:cystathionine beta-lyase/cystathionine gamma-synthase
MEFETLAVHAGKDADYSSMPIYMASTSKHFYTRGGNPTIAALEKAVAALKLCKPWVSLGDAETLVYIRQAEPERGIPAGYVRVSVGLENPKDVIADLAQALNQAP